MTDGMEAVKPFFDSNDMLKPCGKCGNPYVIYRATVTGGKEQRYVKCCRCGQKSNLHGSRADALREWNERFGK